MKIKSLLTLLLALLTTAAFAQVGGVKGRVVSRSGRTALSGVQLTLQPGAQTATTNAEGEFLFEMVEAGEYTLQLEADEFEPLTLAVRVDKLVRNLGTVIMVPAAQQEVLDDAVFAEFDIETAGDANSLPTSLSASKDLFNNIASYNFSEMRFNVRGYDSQYQDIYLNGVRLNDALTGYSPWSLWSGLNDATRNQEVTSGLVGSEFGLGGIAGTTNVNTLPSQMRKGVRASLVSGNQTYRFRAMATYASGPQDNGWSYAFSLSTRQGGNDYVKGVYYNAFGYFAAVEKQFGASHRLALTLLGAPSERGAQQASTQEAYDLVGNNYYNPNWGYQNGKKRHFLGYEMDENGEYVLNDKGERIAIYENEFREGGIILKDGKLYWGVIDEAHEMTMRTELEPGKTYLVRREYNERNKSAVLLSYYVYDTEGNLIAEKTDAPVAELTGALKISVDDYLRYSERTGFKLEVPDDVLFLDSPIKVSDLNAWEMSADKITT
ncbi:MAG: TonB-dependent receptor, partial [Alistipes sp.]|nr:TonB-dependent receptor [Alistipes sp.]